jgi:hypothetical protein
LVLLQCNAHVLASLTVRLFIVQPREHGPKITSEQRLWQCFLAFAVAPIAIALVQGVDHHCLVRTSLTQHSRTNLLIGLTRS